MITQRRPIPCQFCCAPATYTLRRLSDDKRVPACWLCKSMAKWATYVWEVEKPR